MSYRKVRDSQGVTVIQEPPDFYMTGILNSCKIERAVFVKLKSFTIPTKTIG